ncbi:RNA recognition motif domain containing protein [Acanthamoeba castellanii str. Neff]|uniref:RNA recognition motif domain containing protein n=1 Tax=Acanthamoeba castellanii (strain ATCC 30010 / Neff) TaxID=1257118 RepID=L8GQX9_ACACF|nr:RNA recognition motif domain containing protein [Acanthamoeba castellanii str. Neff]ELR15405.1 RNA recognition motif domain containing protein [Acanthamoeba castellanii str. Neff]
MEQFTDELRSVQNHKPPLSANKQHYKNVVNEVEKFIKKAKPEHRLTALYIIDAIVRGSIRQFGSKDVYVGRFTANLERSLDYILQCSEKDQKAARRVIALWHKNKVFPPSVIDALVMVSIRRTGVPPDLPEVDNLPSDTPPPMESEAKSPSPPSLSPSPSVERPSSQPNVLQQIQENAFGFSAPSSSASASSQSFTPTLAPVSAPTDPRLAAQVQPQALRPPVDPRLGAAFSPSPAAATATSPPELSTALGNGHLLSMLGAQMAGLLPAAAQSTATGAFLGSTPTSFMPSSVALVHPPLLRPRSYPPRCSPNARQQAPGKVPKNRGTAGHNPLYFDYGDDDDDDTRLEEQRKLRQEHEERLAQEAATSQRLQPQAPPSSLPQPQPQPQQQWAAGPPLRNANVAPPSHMGQPQPPPQQQQTPEQLAAALASFYGSDVAAPGGPPAYAAAHSHRPAAAATESAAYDPFTPSSFSSPPARPDPVASGFTKVPTTTCYLGGLPPGTTHEVLRAHFAAYGRIMRLKVMEDKNVAFVTFAHRPDAERVKAQGDAGQVMVGGNLVKAYIPPPNPSNKSVHWRRGQCSFPAKVGWARGANPIGAKENFNMETGETLVTVEEAMRHQQQDGQHAGGPPQFSGGRGRGGGGPYPAPGSLASAAPHWGGGGPPAGSYQQADSGGYPLPQQAMMGHQQPGPFPPFAAAGGAGDFGQGGFRPGPGGSSWNEGAPPPKRRRFDGSDDDGSGGRGGEYGGPPPRKPWRDDQRGHHHDDHRGVERRDDHHRHDRGGRRRESGWDKVSS